MNVVPLRKAPPLTDVVGQLRQMADNIESGEMSCPEQIVVVAHSADRTDVFLWGKFVHALYTRGILDFARELMK